MKQALVFIGSIIFRLYFLFTAFFFIINALMGIQYFFEEPFSIQFWAVVIVLNGLWLIVISFLSHSLIQYHLKPLIFISIGIVGLQFFSNLLIDSNHFSSYALLTLAILLLYFMYTKWTSSIQ